MTLPPMANWGCPHGEHNSWRAGTLPNSRSRTVDPKVVKSTVDSKVVKDTVDPKVVNNAVDPKAVKSTVDPIVRKRNEETRK